MQQVDLYRFVADAAYQGAPGAYSEEAALILLGSDARLMPCATLEHAFEAVADGRAAQAVVPVENAVSGTVPQVYELLVAHNLFVAGETAINIDYVLVAPHGTARADVTRVLSHPLALAQCSDFFRQNRRLEAGVPPHSPRAVRLPSTGATFWPNTSRTIARTGIASCCSPHGLTTCRRTPPRRWWPAGCATSPAPWCAR
jgi:prephenate dehydratase